MILPRSIISTGSRSIACLGRRSVSRIGPQKLIGASIFSTRNGIYHGNVSLGFNSGEVRGFKSSSIINNHDHKHTEKSQHEHREGEGHSHSHSAGNLFSHTHSHSSQDSVLLQESGGLKNPAIRITWVGLLVNVGMAVGKGVGGVVFHSQALLADSIHAISDLVSDFLTLATVSLGTKIPTKNFPNGYGRVETLGSLGVSALLIFAGLSMGWNGLFTMIHEVFGDLPYLDNIAALLGGGHSHSHGGGGDEVASINAAWIALGSIAVKEWLYQATMKVADRTGSVVLVANAWHHRIDSLVSVVAVATICSGYLWGISWMDPLGGLIVSSTIARAGYTTAKDAALELAGNQSKLDDRVEPMKQRVANILSKERNMAFDVDKIELAPYGPNYTASIGLRSSNESGASLEDFRATGELLKKHLQNEDRSLKRVSVVLSPNNNDQIL